MPSRRIVRDVNEAARDVARRKMKTRAFLRSRDQRKRVEMRFAHLKTHHGFERMRLRGAFGCTRRVPSRCNRTKSQNDGGSAVRSAPTVVCLSCRRELTSQRLNRKIPLTSSQGTIGGEVRGSESDFFDSID